MCCKIENNHLPHESVIVAHNATVTHCGLHKQFCGIVMCGNSVRVSRRGRGVFGVGDLFLCCSLISCCNHISLSRLLSSQPKTLGTSTPSLSQMALMCFYLHLQILDDSQRREPLLSSALLTTCLSPAPVSATCLWPAGTAL